MTAPTRGEQLLAKVDRALGDLPMPPEATTPPRRGRKPKVPARVGEFALNAAVDRWQKQQAGLVDEATDLLGRRPAAGKLTEADVTERVHRGLWIAWARYLGAPDAKAAWQTATAFGIFFDKWRLTQGLPTAITEERRHERLELLAKIQMILEARGRGAGDAIRATADPAASGPDRPASVAIAAGA